MSTAMAVVAAALVWAVAGGRVRGGATMVPPVMQLERTVANLSATFVRAAVVDESSTAPVHVGRLQPGFELEIEGRHRRAIIAPPPSQLRFRVAAPAGAVLLFGIGVEAHKRDTGAAGVRFRVEVDGRERFARVLNPSATARERRWFDAEVDLGLTAPREVEILLQTELVPAGGVTSGLPGWSNVRVAWRQGRERTVAGRDAPNVLFLLVDTLRADRLGCYGAVPSPSPTLDALAMRGALFEQAVAQSAWTLPSVTSIFTGLPPRSHGVVGVSEQAVRTGAADRQAEATDPSYLSEQLRTLAERAQDAGITTMGVSANPLVSSATNLARGFETFVEFGYEGRERPWRRAEEINRIFLDWLTHSGTHRFFAYLHYMDVHGPYDPPAEYRPTAPRGVRPQIARGHVAQFARRIDRGEKVDLTAAEVVHLRALYDADIRYWDAQLARLLEGLMAAGVRGRTVIVVAADHGEAFLEHGRLKHGGQLYDELIRVPLIIQGPGVPVGRFVEQAQGIDLLPTVGTLLGVEVPTDGPGQNLLGVRGVVAAISETQLGLATNGGAALVSLRTPEWKLIRRSGQALFELYDLVADPAERIDLSGSAPIGQELLAELRRWEASAPPAPPMAAGDPDFRDRLRALGYVD